MKTALAVVALMLVVVVAAALHPVRPYLDFQVMYHADLGLLRGIPVYDHSGQVDMIAQMANVPASQVIVMPFPYPPWYALSTVWLARFPIDVAARIWFGLNLAMFILAAWLLTRDQPGLKSWIEAAAGLLWLPMLGGLLVGQFSMPLLLGAALMVQALRRETPVLVALAATLLSFKPHIGGPLLVLIVVYLALRGDAFARRGLLAVLITALVLFAAGFLASPQWPTAYLQSLGGFRSVSGVAACEQCVSLSTSLARLFGGGLNQALWISGVIALLLAAWLTIRWRAVSATAGSLMAAGILATLLASPYLLNYDYLLLLMPFIELARDKLPVTGRVALGIAYVLPFISLGIWGTAGNVSMIISACILLGIALALYRQANPAGEAA